MPLFGERLRELMTRDDLTQRQLAGSVGMSQGAISHYLRGTRATPGVEEVVALAAYFRVSVDWLLGVDPASLPRPADPDQASRAKDQADLEQIAKTLEEQAGKIRQLLSTNRREPRRRRQKQ